MTQFQQVTPAHFRVTFRWATLAPVVNRALAPVCFRVTFRGVYHKTKHPRVAHRAIALAECRERKLVVALVKVPVPASVQVVVVAVAVVAVVAAVFPLVEVVVFLRVTESLLMCRTFRLLRKTPVIAMRKTLEEEVFWIDVSVKTVTCSLNADSGLYEATISNQVVQALATKNGNQAYTIEQQFERLAEIEKEQCEARNQEKTCYSFSTGAMGNQARQ
ncbi:hypothetical protein [Neosynechococcus sphagnicola]|uniref:hypothetical protein n=1 Tax=Neosynechococcus sphagnicola TaxID=1501145 RepID=UPI0012E091A4|nr:hypothetical protein [Neosynechococcus sphagnicola]